MTKNLAGKKVLITAAAQGIGRATALAFARAGATVHATDINESLLTELSAEPNIVPCKLDVRDDADVTNAATAIGRSTCCSIAPASSMRGSILDMKDGDLDFAFDLNVRSMVRTIRAFLPGMIERGGGAIVNMASVASRSKGVPNRFAYGLTKAAVIGLTKSVAADYVGQGIRCNCHLPRHGGEPVTGRAACARRRLRCRPRRLHRPPADGPARHARGNRRPGRISRRARPIRRDRPMPSMAAGQI